MKKKVYSKKMGKILQGIDSYAQMRYIMVGASLQGRVKFPTGGDSPRAHLRRIRCNSGTDSKVWMEEGAKPLFRTVLPPE